MMIRATVALSLILLSSSARGTELGDAAAALAPGTWVELPTQNIDAMLGWGAHSGNVLPYAFTGVWDPNSRKLIFFGTDHNGGTASLVEYSDDSNTWAEGIVPPVAWAHGYDHLAIDPSTGDLYHRRFGQALALYSYAPGASSWIDVTPPTTSSFQVAIGIEFIPGMGLAVYNSGQQGGELLIYDPATEIFINTVSGFGGDATYHSYIEYSPVHQVAVFGGGNANGPQVWRLNADETVTQLDDAPLGIGMKQASLTHDPGTGDFLVWGEGAFYQFNPAGSGTWAPLSGAAIPPAAMVDPAAPDGPDDLISAAISTYNVNAYVSCVASDCRVFLYKHSNVEPPLPPMGSGGGGGAGAGSSSAGEGGAATTGSNSGGSNGSENPGTDSGADPETGSSCAYTGAPSRPETSWALLLIALGPFRRRLEARRGSDRAIASS